MEDDSDEQIDSGQRNRFPGGIERRDKKCHVRDPFILNSLKMNNTYRHKQIIDDKSDVHDNRISVKFAASPIPSVHP